MLKDIEKLEFNENAFLQRRLIDDSKQLLFPEKDVNHFVTKFFTCIKSKKSHTTHLVLMKSITSSLPLELVGNDFLHYNPCSGDYKFLLVITDHFKRFVQAYPTTKCKSSS